MNDTTNLTPGTRVTLPDTGADVRGTIRQVGSTDHMPAPDSGMVLVAWSRTTLVWEYAEDLLVVSVATPEDPDHPDHPTHLFTRCRCGNTIHRTTVEGVWFHYQTGEWECPGAPGLD